MPTFRPQDLYASVDTPHAQRVKGRLASSCSENDILIANGAAVPFMQVIQADADAIVTARGFLWVAMENGVSGDTIEMVPWRIVRNVNTSGSAAGNPVFMSSTAGGWTLTAPSGASIVQVGEVLVVSATAGVVALKPNANFSADPSLPIVADPGTAAAIPVTTSAMISLAVAGVGETNTLANPLHAGQKLSIILGSIIGGSRAITAAAAINQTGNTIMTFAQADDWILLEGVRTNGNLRWRVAANDGVALS